MLKLLLEDRFPRVWVPSPENRDLRQLLWHRHRLVQNADTSQEPVASHRHERRGAAQARVVEQAWTGTIRVASVGSLGPAATAISSGVAGPPQSADWGVRYGHRAGSRAAARGAAADDPPGRGVTAMR